MYRLVQLFFRPEIDTTRLRRGVEALHYNTEHVTGTCGRVVLLQKDFLFLGGYDQENRRKCSSWQSRRKVHLEVMVCVCVIWLWVSTRIPKPG